MMQKLLQRIKELEEEFNVVITSDVGRIGVYIEDKETEEILCTLYD